MYKFYIFINYNLYRYRDGIEFQLVDEEELSYSPIATPITVGKSSNSDKFHKNSENLAKHARVKGLVNGYGGIHGDGDGKDATILVVRRLTRFDSGRYECRVRNSVGAANSTNFANVRVQCKYT